MKSKAFTLIELLVVVLIIGVLAAIALPQYELAVEKSRLSEVFTMVSSLQKAIDVYLLENGYPASGTIGGFDFLGDNANRNGSLAIDLSNLDCSETVTHSCVSKNFRYTAYCMPGECVVSVESSRSYNFDFSKTPTSDGWHGNGLCSYSSDEPIGGKICQLLNIHYNGELEPCQDC